MLSAPDRFRNCHRSSLQRCHIPSGRRYGDCRLARPGATHSPDSLRNPSPLTSARTATADRTPWPKPAHDAGTFLIFLWYLRVTMSKIRAMIWVTTTAAIKIGSERSYKAPAINPPATAAAPCTAANTPYAVARLEDGTRSATSALTVESSTPPAAPQISAPATATSGDEANASTGTADTSSGSPNRAPPLVRSNNQPDPRAASASAPIAAA